MFDGERGMSLEPMQGILASSHGDGGYLMVFLELQWDPGVFSSVMVGMYFKHLCFLSDVRTPV